MLQCLGESASTGGKCGGSHLPASAVPNPKDHIDPYSNAMHVLSLKIIYLLAAFNSSLLKRRKKNPFFFLSFFLVEEKIDNMSPTTFNFRNETKLPVLFHFTDFFWGGQVKSVGKTKVHHLVI